MKPITDVTALVIDSGLFLPFARRLAEDCKRVLFYNPDRNSFPSLKKGSIGDGFPDIEHTLDFWPLLKDVDAVCFPDVGHAGLQIHLEEMGIPVWGSRRGDSIEINREKFMRMLRDSGLEVPEYSVVVGISALADHLRDKEDQYIKISRWRGDMETTHWRNWVMDNGWIDWMAVNLGPLKHLMRFLVFPAIDTPLEIGADSYSILGLWPSVLLCGTEIKDQCYYGSVTQKAEMPKPILEVMEALSPLLAKHKYKNQISMEIRVKDDRAFFQDATQRASMPGSASQQLLWKNFSEIVWAGANGELVEPDPVGRFSIEAMITTKSSKECWDIVELPEELERSVRFSNCCLVNGAYCFPPDEFTSGDLGWLCAVSDTPQGALEEAKTLCDLLPDGLNASVEQMVEVIKEVEVAGEKGLELSASPMPEPSEVISD